MSKFLKLFILLSIANLSIASNDKKPTYTKIKKPKRTEDKLREAKKDISNLVLIKQNGRDLTESNKEAHKKATETLSDAQVEKTCLQNQERNYKLASLMKALGKEIKKLERLVSLEI